MAESSINEKCCPNCNQSRALDQYTRDKNKSDGLSCVCKSCVAAYQREYVRRPEVRERERVRSRLRTRDRHGDFYIPLTEAEFAKQFAPASTATKRYAQSEKGRRTARARTLKAKYGMSIDEFHDLFRKQRRKCAICRSKFNGYPSVYVDHCHATGKVRGLLCKNCNIALGLLGDNVLVAQNAARYLRRFQQIENSTFRLPNKLTKGVLVKIQQDLRDGIPIERIAKTRKFGRSMIERVATGDLRLI